jgi:hypothetical protein
MSTISKDFWAQLAGSPVGPLVGPANEYVTGAHVSSEPVRAYESRCGQAVCAPGSPGAVHSVRTQIARRNDGRLNRTRSEGRSGIDRGEAVGSSRKRSRQLVLSESTAPSHKNSVSPPLGAFKRH